MANGLNTLNLIQVKGGVNIKQGDSSSVLEYELGYTDGSDIMTDLNLDGKVAKVTLYNRLTNKKYTKDSVVKGNRVSFTIDEALELGVYVVDIDVAGHIFPSDREMYIRVHEGYQSYMDGRTAAVAVATAKNIANEAIRLAVLENAETIRGPKGNPGDSIKVADVTKSGTSNIVTFSDGKTLTVEDGESVFVKSYRILSDGNTEVKFTDGKTAIIKKGDDSKVVSSKYDSSGNTIISFNNGSPDVTVQRGKQGLKGDTGNPVNVASVTKSGTTNTVKFTDGKTMIVEDGESVNVSSTKILDDGNTEITFTDGKKAIVNKGVDGKDAKVDAASIAKLSKSDKDIIRKEINAPSKDEVVLKEVGKGLSDNNFDNQYKKKLDDLDQTFKDVNDNIDKVKSKQDNHLSDLTSLGAYEVGGKIIKLKPTIAGDEVKIGYVEIGKILENDFVVFPFTGEILNIKFKSEADGYVLLYGKPDYEDPEYPELKYVANETEKATKIAIKVDKNINTYLIDFTEVGQGLPGQKFEGNLVITNVTMPEDKASVIREEGL